MTTQDADEPHTKRERLLEQIVREQKQCIAYLADALNLTHYNGTFPQDVEPAISLATEKAIMALDGIRALEAGLDEEEAKPLQR